VPAGPSAPSRRIAATLFLSQSLGSAGFLAASAINSIVGADLAGGAAWAGVPTATYQGGIALAAFVWGRAMDRIGRRPTLVLGMVSGAAGAGLASWAVSARSFASFLAGILLMGFAQSAMQLGRFVAAEVHPAAQRARAIARVVVGGTVGAVVGPLLVGPAGGLSRRLGQVELAGPYGASALLFAAATAVLLWRLHPEPRELARRLAEAEGGAAAGGGPGRTLLEIARDGQVVVAVVSLVCAQVAMVMLMVITSLHMTHHDHALSAVAFVLSSHVVGMYAFSVFSGRLADRWGRRRVILAGAVVLVVACLTAPLSPAVLPISAALFLLGLGWNFCYVGGSSLLSDRLRPEERARTQGVNDFLMGAASALGSLGSGLVFSAAGYGVMGLVAALASLLPLVLAWREREGLA
jgi:MFS family permease